MARRCILALLAWHSIQGAQAAAGWPSNGSLACTQATERARERQCQGQEWSSVSCLRSNNARSRTTSHYGDCVCFCKWRGSPDLSAPESSQHGAQGGEKKSKRRRPRSSSSGVHGSSSSSSATQRKKVAFLQPWRG